MKQYKKDFIDFMLQCEVLKFGNFITKSGRETPFFINTSFYRTGKQLQRLGEFYAQAILENFDANFTVLFGPAYKGIPLSVSIAIALSQMGYPNISYCSNRKEIKDHGDTGMLLGSPLKDADRILIVEDVTTAGTSIAETMPIIQSQAKAEVIGLMVSVDRMERGKGEQSALKEIESKYHFPVFSLVNMKEVFVYLEEKEMQGNKILNADLKDKIYAYYQQYGI
ncbi:orotate phosphoribosyltransferase [Clostridia bacterium]|nr:orotate phosphoribosyltransferase [Clostridia bacterium]